MTNFKNFITSEKFIGPIVLLFIGTIFSYFLTNFLANIIIKKGKDSFAKKRRTTVARLTNNVIKAFIYTIVVVMILDIYGVDTKSLIASLGIAGAIAGLALQETIKDLLSGIAIIIDNYYVIGDIININGFVGEVVEMTLKSTKIKKFSGEVLVITNHNINSVINISQERAGVKIDIPTSYEEKTEKVEKVLKDVVEKVKKDKNIYSDSAYLGIESFADSSILYSIIIYCNKSEQWNVKRMVLKMVKEAYEKENIKIPYTQIEVHDGKEIL